MDDADARATIAAALAAVAPEIDVAGLDPTEELAVEADLDSMDFLHLVEAVSAAVGRDIPERDYPRLATLDDFATYLTTT